MDVHMRTAPSDLARIALDAAPDAMILVDASGTICFTNRQVSALFGYEHDEIVGRKVEMLLPKRYRSHHIGHRGDYLHEARSRPMGTGLDLFGLRKDATEFPVEISLSQLEHVDGNLVAAAIRDSTERKLIEAELITTRQKAESARALADQSRDAAERANQGKSRFLATASHDLRQPLQTLELLNGALRRRATDHYSIDALSQQEQAIGAMSRLLNALLDISKLESGAVNPEPTDFAVTEIFEELRLEFASIAASKGVELEVEASDTAVHSDPSLVEQILRNLVSNAVKYTRQGRVSLRCLQEAASVRLAVLDTGIGIPPNQLPLIYDEFYQVGVAANTSRDGYGLGLSIVQRLVSLLNLRLDVRSEVGKGSEFALVLPASAGHETAKKHGSAGSAATHDPVHVAAAHVLLVEDNPAVCRATTLLLKLEGYQVTPVASLAEALEHVETGHPVDLLISDYHLSGDETGVQVITALRKILGNTLKAVLATGDTSSAIQQLPRDPALRITSKPIRSEDLLELLRALLAQRLQ
jgi:PAS domain S-box-containing protein